MADVRDGGHLRTFESLKFLQNRFGRRHEFLTVPFINGLCVWKINSARVAMHTVQAILVMQVGSGSQPGHADETYGLPLSDACADTRFQYETGHMGIERRDIATVLQYYCPAVTGLGATKDYLAVS